jgi:CheY-like chemotaxis protein
LTLVRGLAELHGGTVRVSSGGAGKGAEFTATLPLDTASTEHPAPAGFVPGTAPQRHRVLVIEDNRDSGDSLRDALAAMGHEVSVARDGPEGLSLAASFAPTVVLCDLGLPRMSGYEVAQRLRADGRFRELPLIALSGYASAEDRERAFAAGFSDHVAKPASMEALGRMLADLPGLAWH